MVKLIHRPSKRTRTNSAEREGTTAMYSHLKKRTKQVRVGGIN